MTPQPKKKVRSIAEILEEIKKRNGGKMPVPKPQEPVRYVAPAPLPPPPLRFILTCWDGDVYILTGFESVEQIHDKIMGLDWVRMPNGSQIKASSIAKIQSYDDYAFQNEQKFRHKRGQYIAGRELQYWDHPVDGRVNDTNIKVLLEPPQKREELPPSTAPKLTDGTKKD